MYMHVYIHACVMLVHNAHNVLPHALLSYNLCMYVCLKLTNERNGHVYIHTYINICTDLHIMMYMHAYIHTCIMLVHNAHNILPYADFSHACMYVCM